MHIINIGTSIKSSSHYKVSNTSFLSGITFLDAELIFWNVSKSYNEMPISNKNSNIMAQFAKCIKNRKDEFDEFFEIGRTLIIIKPDFRDYVYRNGNQETKINFIDALGIKKPILKPVKGHVLEPIRDDHTEHFLYECKEYLSYTSKIVKSSGIPLLFIKDTKYIVAEYYNVKNGKIIILPDISFNPKREVEETNNFIHYTEGFIRSLKQKSVAKLEIPDWVDNYSFDIEKSESENYVKLNDKLCELKKSLNKSKELLNKYRFLKALFSSDGETLEKAVEFILKEIGFDIEKYKEKNRTDLIIKTKSKVAVFEIKGLTKSAKEQNAAQLEKWVSSYHVENGIEPKGILVVNTYKKLKLEERTDIDFPKQMLTYVNRKEQAIITGLQLLSIYLDFKTKKINKKKIESLLFDTIGEIIYKEHPMDLIQKINNDEEETT
ncbi:hypothetical protein [Winogradskyella ouciana]|uniref:Uncharacterized protein n=1 Tax=Winogradskyella ouciana TaxID=2608631 RepID=A0A7K1GFV7_9FLAO|nr:hypothetical protein [Winogradskyella ouciana]MTE27288.1 hypothetical protein [Winogradskyella ouciana]